MNRRDLLISLAGLGIAWPPPAGAQQKAMPVIGLLSVASQSISGPAIAAFRQGLSDIGYVDGQSVEIEYRWVEGHYDRLPGLAAELVDRKVDVILTAGGPAPTLAAKQATSTIPIVFITGGDPVGGGVVATLARPGGNLTGVSFLTAELAPKRLQLLLELVPEAKVVAFLANPNSGFLERARRIVEEMRQAARAKNVGFNILRASTENEIDAAFAALGQLHAEGLVVEGDPFLSSQREQLVALASRYAIPSIYEWRDIAALGGLMTYGTSVTGLYRLAGTYCGKILKGAKPADLPVQQPTTFELVINLKTANALGLTVPFTLLGRADEVIE